MLSKTYMTFHLSFLFLIPSPQILTSTYVLKSFPNYVTIGLLLWKVNIPDRWGMTIYELYSCQKLTALKLLSWTTKIWSQHIKGSPASAEKFVAKGKTAKPVYLRLQKTLNTRAFTLMCITTEDTGNVHYSCSFLLFCRSFCCRHHQKLKNTQVRYVYIYNKIIES